MGMQAARHDNANDLVRDPEPAVRERLASDPATAAEILYFLARDETAEVRRAVAENPATPRKADTILSRDSDYTVRCVLARKIVGDGLPENERTQLWRIGFTILETLARDKLVRVRQSVAQAIKSRPQAPRQIILELARDPERMVASPVLRHSPVLTDDDLADIASDSPDWARAAIAARGTLGAGVSEAIVASGAVPAVTRLLKNKRAVIDDRTIERVADRAPEIEEWHEPLVKRPSLPGSVITKLARFVAAPLLGVLRSRKGLDPETAAGLDEVARSRGVDAPEPPEDEAAGAEARAEHLFSQGRLTDEAVSHALETGDDAFVIAALALRAEIPLDNARYILETRSPRTVTALCWKAGHTMRFALEVQKRISRIPPSGLLNARDGHDYPLSEDEMSFQLDLVV